MINCYGGEIVSIWLTRKVTMIDTYINKIGVLISYAEKQLDKSVRVK